MLATKTLDSYKCDTVGLNNHLESKKIKVLGRDTVLLTSRTEGHRLDLLSLLSLLWTWNFLSLKCTRDDCCLHNFMKLVAFAVFSECSKHARCSQSQHNLGGRGVAFLRGHSSLH